MVVCFGIVVIGDNDIWRYGDYVIFVILLLMFGVVNIVFGFNDFE